MGLVVADFFVHASVPSAELCWWRTLLETLRAIETNATPAVWGVSKEEQNIFATMVFSRGVLNGKKKLFQNQVSMVGTIIAGGKIRSGPQVGKVATSTLPSRGSPPLQSGGQNQKWPTYGQSGWVTPAVSGIPTAAERGTKSEMAHLWAKWLCDPCCIKVPHRCRARGKIRNGPLVGKVATSPLPSRGSPPLQSGGENHKWPTCGQSGYVTPAVSGIPTASERGAKSEVAHLWAKWLCHPCRLGDPHRFRAGDKIRNGPLMGKVATAPLPSRGSPPLQSGGQNQKWPTCGESGYVTPAVSGIPTASEWGAKSEMAHLWAKWLCHPCRLGDPHRFRVGGKIRNGPELGKVATSPLPSRGSPPLQSGGGE